MRFGRQIFCFLLMLTPLVAQQPDTWPEIQDRIITPNCAICHFSGSSFARQSGLVLTADSAYVELVGELPKNTAARTDGLKRVSLSGGFPGVEQSFLWEKINAPNQEHFYNDHPNYGAIMPLGLPYLTNGQLAFIEQWLLNGAPQSGAVADTALLQDTTRYRPPDFVPLDPPANGIQLHVGPFEVWNSDLHDREFLYYEPLITNSDLFINRYEIAYRPGSHHFILFNYTPDYPLPLPSPNTYRDLRDPLGNINLQVALQLGFLFPFQFFVGSQVPQVDFSFAPGVALRLPAGSGFDLNVHSVNRSDTTRIGEVYVNLHTVDPSEVQHAADYDNFGNTDIALPPNQVTTLTKTFTFSEQRHIIQMWSHAHEHMTEFQVVGVGGAHDGQLLYWTNDWAHPPILELDPPLTFEAGDKIKLITTYNNWTNNWIYFGPLSTDEMQFLFYIYYTGQLTGVVYSDPGPVSAFALAQNYPNPFNPTTAISYQLSTVSDVKLQIYNTLGQLVKTLVSQNQPAGSYTLLWDGSNELGEKVASGVYLYRLSAGEYSAVRKLVLMR